jgi:hypothetical protein
MKPINNIVYQIQAFASSRMIGMITLVQPQIILKISESYNDRGGGRKQKNRLWRPRLYHPNSHPKSTGLALWHHPSVILMRLLSGCTCRMPPLTSCGSLLCHHPSTILLPRAYGLITKKKGEEAGTAGSED